MATNLPGIPFLLAGPLLRVSTGVGSQANTGAKAHAFRLPSSLFCCLSFPLDFIHSAFALVCQYTHINLVSTLPSPQEWAMKT